MTRTGAPEVTLDRFGDVRIAYADGYVTTIRSGYVWDTVRGWEDAVLEHSRARVRIPLPRDIDLMDDSSDIESAASCERDIGAEAVRDIIEKIYALVSVVGERR